MRKKTYFIVLLALFIIAILGITTLMWFRYVSNTFDPFITVMDESNFNRSEFFASSWRHTRPLLTYREEIISLSLDTFHTVEIFTPFFLDFGGYISVSTIIPVNFEITTVNCRVMIYITGCVGTSGFINPLGHYSHL